LACRSGRCRSSASRSRSAPWDCASWADEARRVSYLYALATVSITFVGFSAPLLVFRETIGDRMAGYDTYFTLSSMQAGFIVTAGGLLPQLLAFYEISQTSVWRASSLVMAVPIFLFVARITGRRRAATKKAVPLYVGFLLLLQFLAGAYLLLNAAGWPAPPNLAPFALSLTVVLWTTDAAYLIALAGALRRDGDRTYSGGSRRTGGPRRSGDRPPRRRASEPNIWALLLPSV
jgi:hypothetical protein